MPARYRPGSSGQPTDPAGRTRRLLVRYRILSAAQLAGKGLAFAAATLLFPAGLATLDRLCGLWRDREAGRPGQAPEIP
jgi:hypothetical protein